MGQAFRFQRSDTIPQASSERHLEDTQHQTQPEQSHQGLHAREHDWGVHSHLREQLGDFQASHNSLINLSAELLGILTTLPQLHQPGNLSEFRENLVNQVSRFNNRGRLHGHPQNIMDRSCYVLCAALDEGINQTLWGQNSAWENHSLLSRLFQQRNGGETFFLLLEQARQQPEQQTELLEFIYILLRLGFQGRYRQSTPGNQDLSRLCSELYSDICRVRSPVEEKKQQPAHQNWRPLRLFRSTPWLILAPFLLIAGYGVTAFWIDDYNQSQRLSIDELKSWTRPEQTMGAIYNSTREDMEAFSP